MNIATVFVAATLASVLVAEAQPTAAVAADWSRVSLGDTIIVTAKDLHEVRGSYEHVAEGRLMLRVDGQPREFLLSDAQQVAKAGDSLRNGFLIGAAFGWAAGSMMVYMGPCFDPPCTIPAGARLIGGAFGGLVFGGLGAWIDRIIPGRTVIFRPGPTAATVSIAPNVLPRQRGLRVSLSF